MKLIALLKRFAPYLVLVIALALPAVAVPFTIIFHPVGYSGRLLDSASTPISGTLPMTARVFDVATGGVALWEQTFAAVTVDNGYFQVTLTLNGTGVDVADVLVAGSGRYLELVVDGDTLSPRQLITAAPWALRSAL